MGKTYSMNKASQKKKKKKDIPLCKHETNFGRCGYPVNLLCGLN